MLIWSFDRLSPSHSRGAEGVESVEKNRDSRLLIALYSSWPMPASKAIRFPPLPPRNSSGSTGRDPFFPARKLHHQPRSTLHQSFRFRFREKFPDPNRQSRTIKRLFIGSSSSRLRGLDGLQVESYIMLFAWERMVADSLISRGHYREI